MKLLSWDQKALFAKLPTFLLFLFLFIFPKGGIKIAGIPITWGYLLLLLFFIGAIAKGIQVTQERVYAFIACLPFFFITCLSLLLNGISTIPFTLSFLVSLIAIPSLFLLPLSTDQINLPTLLTWLKRGGLFLSCFGIFLFFYKNIMGSFLLSPTLPFPWTISKLFLPSKQLIEGSYLNSSQPIITEIFLASA